MECIEVNTTADLVHFYNVWKVRKKSFVLLQKIDRRFSDLLSQGPEIT